jgi:preprotein translocase subunit SecG
VENLVLTLHIIVCVTLVLLVLLQSGKEGMGVIFGGGSSSLFGSSGAGGILAKLTTFVAVIFLTTSLSYNMLTGVKPSKEDLIREISIDDPSAPVLPAVPGTMQQNPVETPSPQGN